MALAAGRPLVDALDLIERTCAQGGSVYRTALCMAVESATRTSPPKPARITRTLFAEIERILGRLWYLGDCARASDLAYYQGLALAQREALFAALEEATGTRSFWGIAIPGGCREDIAFDGLSAALKELEPTQTVWRAATEPKGPLGRAGAGIGTITTELAEKCSLTGLAAAGALALDDPRQSTTGDGYADLGEEIVWPAESAGAKGDAGERMRVAAADLATSYAIALSCVSTLESITKPAYQARLGAPAANVSGEARIQGPHGPASVRVTLGASSEITRLALSTPADATLKALPYILEDARLEKAPLILASLDLCLECNDQ
jgi:Ni,Fe-hydrogenase III large subunit